MSDAEQYLQRATELERIARACVEPDLRRHMLKLAGDWRDLAKQAIRIEQRSFTRREGGSGGETGMGSA